MSLPDYMLLSFESCHYFMLIDSFPMHVLKLKSISDTILPDSANCTATYTYQATRQRKL